MLGRSMRKNRGKRIVDFKHEAQQERRDSVKRQSAPKSVRGCADRNRRRRNSTRQSSREDVCERCGQSVQDKHPGRRLRAKQAEKGCEPAVQVAEVYDQCVCKRVKQKHAEHARRSEQKMGDEGACGAGGRPGACSGGLSRGQSRENPLPQRCVYVYA